MICECHEYSNEIPCSHPGCSACYCLTCGVPAQIWLPGETDDDMPEPYCTPHAGDAVEKVMFNLMDKGLVSRTWNEEKQAYLWSSL